MHENFISYFLRKKFIWGNLIFLGYRPFSIIWLGMVKLSQVISNWILKQSGHDFFHDYYWIFKQSGHNYDSVKTWFLRSTIMWWTMYGYYVTFMCAGQHSWFCKASLRICYVSLFKCKGSWMVKTVMCRTEDYKTRLKKYHVQCC